MNESGENYLETILLLKAQNGQVRSVDVAKMLGYSKPSVSRAMGLLKSDGYIFIDENGYIELTVQGEKLAKSIYDKHVFFTEFLVKFAEVPRETAEEDACRIEHVISDDSFEVLKRYMSRNGRRIAGGMHQRR